MRQNNLKVILVIFVACALIGSTIFFVQAGRHSQTKNEILNASQNKLVATFQSSKATLTLFTKDNSSLETNNKAQGWIAHLRLHMPNCNGGMGISPQADPPIASLETGSLSNGQMIIKQSPTIGEPACKVSLTIKDGIVSQSKELLESCNVWHGLTCHFDTATLENMK